MTGRVCTIDGCGRPHKGRDYCNAHYKRWKRHGDPLAGGSPAHRPAQARPFPIGPLLAHLHGTAKEWAATLGVSERTYLRLVHVYGALTEDQADLFATRVGLHPCELWPEWWETSAS